MKSCFAAALLLASAAAAHGAEWTPVVAKSTVSFSGSYDGEPFDGRFRRFTAEVTTDAATNAPSRVAAVIDLRSADTSNAERDETLATAEFFDTARFPEARFRTTACRGAAPKITCDAELTIRDRTRPLVFPLTWTHGPDGTAKLESSVVVKRLAFGVGSGDWADTALIPDAVTVRIALVLQPAP